MHATIIYCVAHEDATTYGEMQTDPTRRESTRVNIGISGKDTPDKLSLLHRARDEACQVAGRGKRSDEYEESDRLSLPNTASETPITTRAHFPSDLLPRQPRHYRLKLDPEDSIFKPSPARHPSPKAWPSINLGSCDQRVDSRAGPSGLALISEAHFAADVGSERIVAELIAAHAGRDPDAMLVSGDIETPLAVEVAWGKATSPVSRTAT